MTWNQLTDHAQIEVIDNESKLQKVLIFKHSTRCSISAVVFRKFEKEWKDSDHIKIKPYYLDLLQYRSLSNTLASHYGVQHESPQVLIIENGKSIYNESHYGIEYAEIFSLLKNQTSKL